MSTSEPLAIAACRPPGRRILTVRELNEDIDSKSRSVSALETALEQNRKEVADAEQKIDATLKAATQGKARSSR